MLTLHLPAHENGIKLGPEACQRDTRWFSIGSDERIKDTKPKHEMQKEMSRRCMKLTVWMYPWWLLVDTCICMNRDPTHTSFERVMLG